MQHSSKLNLILDFPEHYGAAMYVYYGEFIMEDHALTVKLACSLVDILVFCTYRVFVPSLWQAVPIQ
jgi:hypothetical protein